jgi:bifunctional DNase/RNase
MYDLVNKTPVVILKEINGDRYLPILIGMFEASAIEMGIRETPLPRPMTHDLLNNIINHLQLTVEYILINKIEDSTFFANIILYQEGSTMEVDSRPSDAIALAIRTHAPILVEEEILTKAGIKMNPHKAAEKEKGFSIEGGEGAITPGGEPDISADDAEERFRDFIDGLRPDDFMKSDTTLPESDMDSTGLDELIEDDENDEPV